MNIFDFLFPPRADEIIVRDISVDAFLALVAPRLADDTRPATVVLLSFSNASVRATIHEAKYHGNTHAFRLLGSALAEYLRDCDDVGRTTSYIVPVPLGKERLKERGFNQVEEIARSALRSFSEEGLCSFSIDSDLLARTRETISQISLLRAKREKNMRGAFIVSPKLEERRRIDPACTYILLDDVLTTGATLQAAIDALTHAGAEYIIPLALAH